MKEPAWLPAARALTFGHKRKIECPACNTPGTLMLNHGSKGYSAYCFRASCGLQEFHPHGVLSLAQLAERRLATSQLMAQGSTALPWDCTEDLPIDARIWLLKAGVSNDLCRLYGIKWSPTYSRVILPISVTDNTLGYVARSLSLSPKYIAKTTKSSGLFMGLRDTVCKENLYNKIDLVLTEDILSAIRVQRIAPAAAILGTAFGDGLSQAVMAACGKPRPVIAVWTDGDKAGTSSRVRIRRTLTLQGALVVSVVTKRDPKFHSNREIRECLATALHTCVKDS